MRLLQLNTLSSQLAAEIGELLACVHLEPTPGYGDLTEPQNLSSDPRSSFISKFQEGIDECKNHLTLQLLERCQQHFERDVDLLLSTGPPCIIHRDFRPGNILVDKGKVTGVIDWSSGRSGCSEEDFAPLEFGEWSNHLVFKKAFLNGYTSVRRPPDYKVLMPLMRLSRAIAAIGFTVKRGTWNTEHRKLYAKSLKYLERVIHC